MSKHVVRLSLIVDLFLWYTKQQQASLATTNMFGLFASKKEELPTKPQKKPKALAASVDPEFLIAQKLRKTNKQAHDMPENEMLEWARSLCVKTDLKTWYLNKDFVNTQSLVCNIFTN